MPEIFAVLTAIVFTLALCVFAYMTDGDRNRPIAMQPAHGEPNPQSTRRSN